MYASFVRDVIMCYFDHQVWSLLQDCHNPLVVTLGGIHQVHNLPCPEEKDVIYGISYTLALVATIPNMMLLHDARQVRRKDGLTVPPIKQSVAPPEACVEALFSVHAAARVVPLELLMSAADIGIKRVQQEREDRMQWRKLKLPVVKDSRFQTTLLDSARKLDLFTFYACGNCQNQLLWSAAVKLLPGLLATASGKDEKDTKSLPEKPFVDVFCVHCGPQFQSHKNLHLVISYPDSVLDYLEKALSQTAALFATMAKHGVLSLQPIALHLEGPGTITSAIANLRGLLRVFRNSLFGACR